jgi:uncharacterized protein (TIGR00255 family)
MAISGMTGFARVSGARGDATWVWEAKSVNGRGLDVRFRLPPGLDAIEQRAREAAQKRFKRGSLTASLQLQRQAATAAARVNVDQLAAVIAASRRFIEKGVVEPARLDGLLALKGVMEVDEGPAEDEAETAALHEALLSSLDQAFASLDVARREEGAALGRILADAVTRIDELRGAAASLAALQPDAIRDRFKQKLKELLDGELPEDRLAMEAAVLAVKADVREEIDRLGAHVEAARELLKAKEPAGRKLDFLCQEFNREANTLCAKSPDPELTRIGLDLKATIDQFREQAQNVE